jgi:hypothetical protein
LPDHGNAGSAKSAERLSCRQLRAQATWEVSGGYRAWGMQTDDPLAAVCMPFLSGSNDL